MIIDFHTHIVSPQIKQNREEYVQRDHNFAAIYSDPKAKLAAAEDLIANMDKDGVDMSVVLGYGWETPELCKEVNDYIMESAAKYPKRLAGMVTVTMKDIDGDVKEVEAYIKAGAIGVGEMRLDILGKNWLGKVLPIAEPLIKNKSMMLVHSSEPIGHIYPGKGAMTPDLLYKLIAEFPEMRLVCAHWGGGLPFYALMPEVKAALKNVYFDTAASPFLYSPQIWSQVAQSVGEDKILFGSDFPVLPPRRYFKELDGINLTAETREKILEGNAKRLLGN